MLIYIKYKSTFYVVAAADIVRDKFICGKGKKRTLKNKIKRQKWEMDIFMGSDVHLLKQYID